MNGGVVRAGSFGAAYAAALDKYLLNPDETSLRVAYELGREAVSRQLSVLDLAVAHHEALLSALAVAADLGKVQVITRTAGDFFLESLSSFEMVQRGFREARRAFLLERRQTELSRQLSTFLADASLALDASNSLEEMLRLVAEQARELVGADCCLATVATKGQPRTAEAVSHPESDRRWSTVTRWLDLVAIYGLIRSHGGSVKMDSEHLARTAEFHTVASDPPLHGWLAASLTTLHGAELGAIQLFDKQKGDFTADDQAALVYLAQMASAAIERSQLYQGRG